MSRIQVVSLLVLTHIFAKLPMPQQTKVLCLCCNQMVTRHRERAHRARLQTPYSTSARTTSKLAAITSISSDESSNSDLLSLHNGGGRGADVRLDDPMDGQLSDADSLPDNDTPEQILRSWVPLAHGPPLHASQSDDHDHNNAGTADEPEEHVECDDDYPEWDHFVASLDGVAASDMLSEGYEQEAAAVGTS